MQYMQWKFRSLLAPTVFQISKQTSKDIDFTSKTSWNPVLSKKTSQPSILSKNRKSTKMPEIWLTSKCWICFGMGPKNNKKINCGDSKKWCNLEKKVFIRSFEKNTYIFKSISKATLYKEYIHSLHFKPRHSMGLLYLPTFGREI